MSNKKSNLVERRLYEYALHAICSPLHIIEPGATTDQLAVHIAKLFNIDSEEHEMKYMRALKTQPSSVILYVDVKRARDLLGEDQNGLSDPYCKVSVVYTPYKPENFPETTASSLYLSPAVSPSQIKRTRSFFSCTGSSCMSTPKLKLKTSSSLRRRRSTLRKPSIDNSFTISTDKNKTLATVTYRTEVCPKTINPEWNEHFEFEIQNVDEQQLLISVFDSDRGQLPGVKTIVQEKRGVTQKLRGIRTLFATGQIDDDFLGQMMLNIKSIPTSDRDRWFPLTGLHSTRAHNTKSRGEIFLGLKVHFKLDETNFKKPGHVSYGVATQFRRRHSTVSSHSQVPSSIILRSSIFRRNFRPLSLLPVRDFRGTSIFDNDTQSHASQTDLCLTPATDSDLPLLIEEYHQLFRIIILHQLEDTRELYKDQSNGLVIDWNGRLNELSYSVLVQFRVLYNISILSESFIQLLVIMELRCSDDYALFISQGVIEAYLKLFMNQVHQRSDANDLDFTDYEKTVFKEILDLFIGHYKQRIHNDAPWFPPSKENLPNVQSVFEVICTLLQLKISSTEATIKTRLEDTFKIRLQTDINDLFNLHPFTFNDKDDIQLNILRKFVDFIKKLNDSMAIISEYHKIFALFNINYIKICFFECNSAGDRIAELTKCLLTSMTDCFRTYSKPVVKATSSIYDPNLIQYSIELFRLYLNLKNIVISLKNNLGPQMWSANAFKLKLIEYSEWFATIMQFLLEGFVAHIRQAMERAVEDDNEPIPDEDIVLHSPSATAVTNTCIQLCEEWQLVDYPDIKIRYTALIKLTNTICEQCQHYARRTALKLSENKYFTDLDQTRSFNVSRKLCVLVNDIEFVKHYVLSSLPTLLQFSSVIEKMIEYYQSDNFHQTQVTLERLIATAKHEMTDVINFIFERVGTLYHDSLLSKIETYYHNEKARKDNCMIDVNEYIDEKILRQLYKGLEPVHYSRVACAIRLKTLQCLKELLPKQELPDFYERVLQSFDKLIGYFETVCLEEVHPSGSSCEEITKFRRTLQIFTSTTEQLQLLYFREILKIHSPHEYQTNHGEIVFRTAYELVNSLVTIQVFILCCRDLPKMDLIGTSDPYVVLELLPYSLYHKPIEECRTCVRKQTLDPEFNELFQWHRLPTNVLNERGAVLHLSVWDKDCVNDDFIGECFISLTDIEPLKNVASLRDIPVSEVRLRRPHKNSQPQSFELIRHRATVDAQAAVFLKQRTAIMQSGNVSDGASAISDDGKSSVSYASTTLRSLLCMFPFHMGFGADSASNYHQSDVANDEELI